MVCTGRIIFIKVRIEESDKKTYKTKRKESHKVSSHGKQTALLVFICMAVYTWCYYRWRLCRYPLVLKSHPIYQNVALTVTLLECWCCLIRATHQSTAANLTESYFISIIVALVLILLMSELVWKWGEMVWDSSWVPNETYFS